MAEKPNSPDPKNKAPAGEEEQPAPVEKAPSSLLKTLLPVVLVLVGAPAVCWAVAQFVLLPHLEKRLEAVTPAAAVQAAAAPAAKEGKAGPGATSFNFSNVVVNLAGTMGTRYLKTSFVVTGSDPKLHDVFETNQPKLLDLTINVLSSLTLSDLDDAGAKNVIRQRLVLAYNHALGRPVAKQVYFSDFVVQ